MIAGYYLCDDPACLFRSQQVLDKGYPLCPTCQRCKMRRETPEKELLVRCQYIVALFDVEHQQKQATAAGSTCLWRFLPLVVGCVI